MDTPNEIPANEPSPPAATEPDSAGDSDAESEIEEDDVDDVEAEMTGTDEPPLPPIAPIPPATNILDPIPPLREVRARVINIADSEKSSEESSGSIDENTAVLLEDPAGFAGQPAAISTWAYALALLFDGRRSALDAVEAFREKYGQSVPPLQALVLQNELEQAMFLHSTTFEENVQRRLNQYLDLPAWPAAHAGTAYPAEPDALMKTFTDFFSAPGGPGAEALFNGSTAPKPDETAAKISAVDITRAVIAPHIDLSVGGATYAHAYKELMHNSQAELIFVLGVAHQAMSDKLFCVSQKDFQTPLGMVRTNKEIAKRLHEASGCEDVLAELTHRGEHSIEFQAALINALLGEKCNREVQIVPILCGSIDGHLARNISPFKDAEFIRFTDALRKEIETCGKKWCVLCSVDLSHVGPEFGHNSIIDYRLLKPVERLDRKMLKLVANLDVEGFYNEIARTQNSRHVDAVLSVLTMLSACRSMLKDGRLLHYDLMMKEQSHSAVSYAAMAFSAAGG